MERGYRVTQELYIGQDDDIVNDDIVDEAVVVDAEIVDEMPGDKLPKGASRNDDGSVTLTLIKPVDVQIRDQSGKVRTDTYDSLTFHHLTGADLRAIRAAKAGDENIVAFARATRISEAVMNRLFDKMHIADINAGGEVMASFLTPSR